MLDVGPHRGRAPVAQWIEHLTTDQKVGGSSPSGRAGRRPGTVTVPGLSRICRRPADIRALTSVLPTPAAVAVELGEEGLGGGELGSQLRSEEHTSELQSRGHLVCRLLLEKKKSRSVRQQH